jgi:hypothetical protein
MLLADRGGACAMHCVLLLQYPASILTSTAAIYQLIAATLRLLDRH